MLEKLNLEAKGQLPFVKLLTRNSLIFLWEAIAFILFKIIKRPD